tara:strand:- start:190 stop:372 length:183 start_codon:yes stop_codon:yes gene_type:complete
LDNKRDLLMSNPHLEAIAACKRMIKYFEGEIKKYESIVYNQRCCWDYKKKRIQLKIAGKQ